MIAQVNGLAQADKADRRDQLPEIIAELGPDRPAAMIARAQRGP